MSNRLVAALCAAAIGLTGCASNVAQVRERGAIDLSCEANEVSVTLVDRISVGVTRYEAQGCGDSRSYECTARIYQMGIPIGQRTCKRTGSAKHPTVLGDGGVGF